MTNCETIVHSISYELLNPTLLNRSMPNGGEHIEHSWYILIYILFLNVYPRTIKTLLPKLILKQFHNLNEIQRYTNGRYSCFGLEYKFSLRFNLQRPHITVVIKWSFSSLFIISNERLFRKDYFASLIDCLLIQIDCCCWSKL